MLRTDLGKEEGRYGGMGTAGPYSFTLQGQKKPE